MIREPQHLSLRYSSPSVRHEDAAISADGNSCGKEQSAAGWRGVNVRRGEGDLHNITVAELLSGNQLRRVESAVRPERAPINRPQACCPWRGDVQHRAQGRSALPFRFQPEVFLTWYREPFDHRTPAKTDALTVAYRAFRA